MNLNISSPLRKLRSKELPNDFEDFFEYSSNGLLTIDPHGEIIRANSSIAGWLGCKATDLAGINFSELLTAGSKLSYEKYLLPLLQQQGFFEQAALELAARPRKQILVDAFERRDENDQALSVRLTVCKATDHTLYEQTLIREKETAEKSLFEERAVSTLREQFIAVLGHDLRNPLAAILGGTSLLLSGSHNQQEQSIITTMQNSALRMAEMIENIMDFARGRLGGGMIISRKPTALAGVLSNVADELRAAFPEKIIKIDFGVEELVDCDAPRIAQLFSNLLANALTHGSPETPVFVRAFNCDQSFELSVSNMGQPIPAAALNGLFDPFAGEDIRPSQNGLGLGLYIAAEIARAHQGKITVVSDEKGTCFTFRMKTID